MPSFSRSLEKALHQALAFANERRHDYATLEHLLLALAGQDVKFILRVGAAGYATGDQIGDFVAQRRDRSSFAGRATAMAGYSPAPAVRRSP